MSRVLALEKESLSRSLFCALVLFLCFLPVGAFLAETLGKGLNLYWVEPSYLRALLRSVGAALCVSILTLLIGLPLGTLSALYQFSGKSILLGLLGLPLLVPSFLSAIGLSNFRIALGLPDQGVLSGTNGTVLAFLSLGLPLVVFTTILTVGTVGQSQVDSARLMGGEKLVWKVVLRSVFPFAILASAFAGAMTLSDPGPGQIFGSSSVASHILTSFSALYDFELASWQCLGLAGVTAILTFPLIFGLRKTISQRLFAKELRPIQAVKHTIGSKVAPLILGTLILILAGIPVVGLGLGFSVDFPVARAWSEISRTLLNTIFYATVASFTATVIGLALSILVGRSSRAQLISIPLMMVAFALPSILGGLGLVRMLNEIPAELDLLLRGKVAAAILLGLRWCPIAFLILLRGYNSTSKSWVESAAVHGMLLRKFLARVILPRMYGALVGTFFICALLATADVGLLLLARPPGEDSFPVAIFTVMANAPEALVSLLCLFYIFGAAAVLITALSLRSILQAKVSA